MEVGEETLVGAIGGARLLPTRKDREGWPCVKNNESAANPISAIVYMARPPLSGKAAQTSRGRDKRFSEVLMFLLNHIASPLGSPQCGEFRIAGFHGIHLW